MTKITIEISEEEIAGLESCVEAAENDGYKEDSAWETLRKIREAAQQSVQRIGYQTAIIPCPHCGVNITIDSDIFIANR